MLLLILTSLNFLSRHFLLSTGPTCGLPTPFFSLQVPPHSISVFKSSTLGMILLSCPIPGGGGAPLVYDPGCDLWSGAPDVLASAIETMSPPAPHSSYDWDLSTSHGHLCFLFPKGSSEVGRLDLDSESMVVEDGPGYRVGATVAETDGYIYMMGGENEGGEASARVDRYSVRIEVWGRAAPLGLERSRACSAVLGRWIYVLGGRGPSEVLTSVERYHNDLFSINEEEEGSKNGSVVAHMTQAREGAKAVSYNGKVYVIGGQNDEGKVLACGEVYSPVDDSWSPLAPMSYPRIGFRVAVVEDRMVVVGGRTEGGDSLETVEMFCLLSSTWVAEVAQLPDPRVDFALVTTPSNAILPSTLAKMRCNEDTVVLRAQRMASPLMEHFDLRREIAVEESGKDSIG